MLPPTRAASVFTGPTGCRNRLGDWQASSESSRARKSSNFILLFYTNLRTHRGFAAPTQARGRFGAGQVWHQGHRRDTQANRNPAWQWSHLIFLSGAYITLDIMALRRLIVFALSCNSGQEGRQSIIQGTPGRYSIAWSSAYLAAMGNAGAGTQHRT